MIYILLIFLGVSLAVVLMNWMERKALAHMQVRLGPMRVGPHGLLQPIADAIKLLLKEDIIPSEADKLVFLDRADHRGAGRVHHLHRRAVRSDPCCDRHEHRHPVHAGSFVAGGAGRGYGGMGIEFTLSADGSAALQRADGFVRNRHGPGGDLRDADDQPAWYRHVRRSSSGAGTGTLSMIDIVRAQDQPAGLVCVQVFPAGTSIAFIIFAIAMVAETNRAPFDLPEAESELMAGFHTEYSGFRWSLFFLAEYAAMIAVSAIALRSGSAAGCVRFRTG